MNGKLAHQYGLVKERVAEACLRASRPLDSVRLLAVSKFQPLAAMLEIASLGQRDFGENYVQEAFAKRKELGHADYDKSFRWDLIGHVQSRKASQVAGEFYLIHTVDSVKLANGLEGALAAKNKIQKVLLEVNIGEEAQKSGIMPKETTSLAAHIMSACPHLKLEGLMCLPPFFENGECSRPYFARLRHIRDDMEHELGEKFPELSMGMSGDFEVAIQEGATIVRVGTSIFGPRPLKQ